MGLVSEPQTSSQPESASPRVVIITGMSGAGRRTAAHAMEDLGWFVVDNLPPSMLSQLVETARRGGQNRVAVGLDVRSREMFDQLPRSLAQLEVQGIRCALVTDEYSAKMTREHNDTNMLALGANVTTVVRAKGIVDIWLEEVFSHGERHQRRIDKISAYEKTH